MTNKKINLDQMKSMSIDNIINLYEQGYTLENGLNNEKIENLAPLISSLAVSSGIINPQTESNYLIFQDGTTINAKNSLTGKIDFTGNDARAVIQNAINNLTSGRTWSERIVIKGIYLINNITNWISIPDYTIIDLYGKLISTDNTKLMIGIFGDNVELNHGDYDGNRISNDATIWSGFPTGTGIQQTLSHGLPVTPTILELRNIDDGANPYISQSPDTINIYITATTGLKYQWRVLV